ncbi:MAG TPA: DUF2007 domain-containing protein [Anaeromyxobacter sp.]|nr:DUF2007 domain-containing protein [Anaeromyxobacter sp.]
MNDELDLVAIASFETLSEAEVARSLLEAEGIEAVFRDQPLASLLPPVAFANGGLTLLVAPDDAERARDVLASPDLADAEADAEDEEAVAPEASGEEQAP